MFDFKKYIMCVVCFSFSIFAFSEVLKDDEMDEDDVAINLSRADNLPQEVLGGAPDPYFEGYIQALVDMHFYEYQVIVVVKDHEVLLSNLPKNDLTAKSIISFVADVPGVKSVKVVDGLPPKEAAERETYVNRPQVSGIWFPQTTELFLPFIASPRQIIYSIGYRGGDRVMGKTAVAFSIGGDFPIFRWLDVFCWKGDLQISIEAGIWSVFNMIVEHHNRAGGTELVNTDYAVGFPLTYAINQWSFRLRLYHISSHLGDEFLVNHPHFHRKNPSFEALDFFFSYQVNKGLRLYAGPGVILHSDDSYPMKYFYAEYGGEFRFCGTKFYYHKLYGTYVVAAHFRNWQFQHFDFDGTLVAGYEWSKLQGVGSKIRLLAGGHVGFSAEGQFSRKKTAYGTVGIYYGF